MLEPTEPTELRRVFIVGAAGANDIVGSVTRRDRQTLFSISIIRSKFVSPVIETRAVCARFEIPFRHNFVIERVAVEVKIDDFTNVTILFFVVMLSLLTDSANAENVFFLFCFCFSGFSETSY